LFLILCTQKQQRDLIRILLLFSEQQYEFNNTYYERQRLKTFLQKFTISRTATAMIDMHEIKNAYKYLSCTRYRKCSVRGFPLFSK